MSFNCCQRSRALRSGGIRNTKVELQMELNRNTEVESLQVSPPDAKPVLYAVIILFFVRWQIIKSLIFKN